MRRLQQTKAVGTFAAGTVIVIALVAGSPNAHSLSQAEVLKLIEAGQRNLRSARFSMNSVVDTLENDGITYKKGARHAQISGVLSLRRGYRYRMETDVDIPVITATEESPKLSYRRTRMDVSRDGDVQMTHYYSPGEEDGMWVPGRGVVQKVDGWNGDRAYLPVIQNRLGYLTPLYEGIGLKEYLESIPKEAPRWRVLPSDRTDVIHIWFPHRDCVPEGNQDNLSYVVALDMRRGMNIVSWEKWFQYESEYPLKVAEVTDVALEEMDGSWCVTSFVHKALSYNPNIEDYVVTERTKSTLKWCDVGVQFDDSEFSLEFPPGIRIRDDIAGRYYYSPVSRASERR